MNALSSRFYSPAWLSRFQDRLVVAESTRHGGCSPAPYTSLNLGWYTDDPPIHVKENRHLFCADLGFDPDQLAGGFQVHGDRCLRVKKPGQWEGYDAFITNKTGIFLSVTIADCTPVLLYDPVQKAVGAAHAGWRGTVQQIAAKTIRAMRDAFGSRPTDCWAYIGTCIGPADFAVDADVADHFDPSFKVWEEAKGKFFVDLKQANQSQLLELGLPATQIECSPYSTVTHNQDYFSHRAEKGQTGRMLAVIGLR